MLVSQGELGVFFANGLVGSLTALALTLLFWPMLAAAWAGLRAGTLR
jgi:putative tricarboxylic transport membrane protein